jgi:ComF family protein
MLRICKVCFKEFNYSGVQLFNNKICICFNCFNELLPVFLKFELDGVKCLNLYDYNDGMKTLIYNFKGCYDYELKDVFLSRFLLEIKLRYIGYVLVPLPSTKKDDEERGFNHVVEMFSILGLPIISCIFKKVDYKQSDLNKEQRKEVYKKLDITCGERLRDKKVLIVDDIMTTGSSLKATIKLIKPYKPKKLKVLVLSRKVNNS